MSDFATGMLNGVALFFIIIFIATLYFMGKK